MGRVLRAGGTGTELKGLGHAATALLRGFAERIAGREEPRAGQLQEWTDLPIEDGEAYCIDAREGRLVRVPSDGTWILFMCWAGHDARVLTRGKRGHVESYAREVLSYGPPGGPAYQGEVLTWMEGGEDATLRAVTVGGEFRLMPLSDGAHLLLFARNDYTVLVLAMGDRGALQRDAEEHLQDFRGDGLRIKLGDGKVDLHGLGVGSVVAYLEVMHDARLVLGHLGGDVFGLFHTRGTENACLRLYSLTDLRRGDLGCTFGWTFSTAENTASTATGTRPPDLAVMTAPPVKTAGAVKPPGPRRVRLDDDELTMIHRHLSCTEASGPGATVVPRIFEGLRVLIELGEGDRLLRASELRQLLADRARVRFHCCSKTLARSLAVVAARTRLLQRVGRRWRLRLGELLLERSELLAEIKAEYRAYNDHEMSTAGYGTDGVATDLEAHVPSLMTSAAPGDDRGPDDHPPLSTHPYQQNARTDDGLTVRPHRLMRLPANQAASRWPGRKPRGPPRT